MGFALTLRIAVIFLGTCVFTQSALDTKPSQPEDGGDRILDGDVINTKEQYKRQLGNDRARSKRAFVEAQDKLWPNGIVYYDYEKEPDKAVRHNINKAMNVWRGYTCIQFINRKNSTGYLNIKTNSSGCGSFVGFIGTKQDLDLGPGCLTHSTILHMLGQAIGLGHEVNHPDRDKFVKINYANIVPGQKHNFDKVDQNDIRIKTQFDYNSIMHFSDREFSKNGKRVIETLDSAIRSIIGHGKPLRHLSFRDIKAVNLIYNCNGACDIQPGACPGEGFVDDLCECVCPRKDSPFFYDTCEKPNCQNGGTFVKKTWGCNCANDFTGEECGCKKINCLNGGQFDVQNCLCKCVGGFFGRDCGCKDIGCLNGGTFDANDCSCKCVGDYVGWNCACKPIRCPFGSNFDDRNCKCRYPNSPPKGSEQMLRKKRKTSLSSRDRSPTMLLGLRQMHELIVG